MNREIKFRAWHIALNRFVPTDSIFIRFDGQKIQSGGCWAGLSDKSHNSVLILEQYTELKDKNGKEIYEGDILTHGKTYPNLIVNWNYRTASFNIGGFSINTNLDFSVTTNSLEVIGNIHENKDLIK